MKSGFNTSWIGRYQAGRQVSEQALLVHDGAERELGPGSSSRKDL